MNILSFTSSFDIPCSLFNIQNLSFSFRLSGYFLVFIFDFSLISKPLKSLLSTGHLQLLRGKQHRELIGSNAQAVDGVARLHHMPLLVRHQKTERIAQL